MRRPPSITVLLCGIAVLVLGVLLVLNAGGTIDLRFAYTAPVLVGALGAILRTQRAAVLGSRSASACWSSAVCCSCVRPGLGRETRSCGPLPLPRWERC
jgi:hypothetical protein